MASKKSAKKATKKATPEPLVAQCKTCSSGSGTGVIYVLGLVGALIHYLSAAAGFWAGVVGVLKAVVWPVFVVMTILGL